MRRIQTDSEEASLRWVMTTSSGRKIVRQEEEGDSRALRSCPGVKVDPETTDSGTVIILVQRCKVLPAEAGAV